MPQQQQSVHDDDATPSRASTQASSNHNDDDDDDSWFVPLTMEQCWERSRLIFRQDPSLYLHMAAFVVVPLELFFVVVLPVTDWDTDREQDYRLLEVLTTALACWILSGPMAVATLTTYYMQSSSWSSSAAAGGGNHASLDWMQCLAILTNNNNATTLLTANAMAIFGVSFASLFLYLPGLWLGTDWFFGPCWAVLRHNDRNSGNNHVQSAWSCLRKSKQLSQVSRATLRISLVLACGAYLVALLSLALVSCIVRELVRSHVLFGHKAVANFVSTVVYTLPSTAFKIVFLAHWFIYKTVLFCDFRIKKERWTVDELRAACAQSPMFFATTGMATDEEQVALTTQPQRQQQDV